MLEFQEKRKLRRFIYSKITLIILIVVIGFVIKAVWGVYEKQSLTKDNLEKISINLDSLQAREKMLSSEIERLKTEEGIEEEVREKYGLVKPGEEVIVVVNSDETESLNSDLSKISFWQKIVNWFR